MSRILLKKRSFFTALAACVALAGCVPSLNGLYDARTLTFSEKLLGSWTSSESGAHFLFMADPVNPKFYRVIYAEPKGQPAVFEGALARLKGGLYLDIVPEEPLVATQNGFLGLHVSTWHSFARVSIGDKALTLNLADPIWLEKYLALHPAALAHFVNKSVVYVTADTAALQTFVVAHGEIFGGAAHRFTRE